MPKAAPSKPARTKPSGSKQAGEIKQVQGHDERNIARLALALAQNADWLRHATAHSGLLAAD